MSFFSCFIYAVFLSSLSIFASKVSVCYLVTSAYKRSPLLFSSALCTNFGSIVCDIHPDEVVEVGLCITIVLVMFFLLRKTFSYDFIFLREAFRSESSTLRRRFIMQEAGMDPPKLIGYVSCLIEVRYSDA